MMDRKIGFLLAGLIVCAPILGVPEAAVAEKVGVAAAVDPDAF